MYRPTATVRTAASYSYMYTDQKFILNIKHDVASR